MPSEPNKKMEELLKAAAQKRRAEAGAPFEPHPATRNLLQAEVARLRKESPAAKASWLNAVLALWPRFAVGGALVVALVLTIFIRMQSASRPNAEFKLTKNSATESESLKEFNQLSLSDQKADALEQRAKRPGSETPANLKLARSLAEKTSANTNPPSVIIVATAAKPGSQAAPGAARADAATAPGAVELGEAAGAGGKLEARRAGLAATNSTTRALAIAVPALSLANRYQNQNFNSQSATRYGLILPAQAKAQDPAASPADSDKVADSSPRKAAPQAPAAKSAQVAANNSQAFLNSFTVEQTADQLRVIDEDGSIYLGALVGTEKDVSQTFAANGVAQAGESKDKLLREKRKSGAEALPQIQTTAGTQLNLAYAAPVSNQVYFFRVAGTNRSLNQLVVFNGNFTATNALAANEKLGVQAVAGQSANSMSPIPFFLIQGQAQLGKSTPVEINAAPLER
ncbi:MAG: hypothetical protein HY043_02900 [Verrucomicrobia bacterium]|nr:hypothetical protein [Verrucomicrobiota bacterium]